MGWTSMPRERGQSDVDFYTRQLGLDRDGYELVAHNTEGSGFSRTFYGAVRHPDGRVFGLVVLGEQHGREFAWKDMDETMGPNAVGVSAEVLDALTDTDSQYALEWRKRARADIERREQIAAMTKGMKPGAWLRFKHPVNTTDGRSYSFGRFAGRNKVMLATEDQVARLIASEELTPIAPRWGTNLGNGWKNRLAAVTSVDSPAEFRGDIDPVLMARIDAQYATHRALADRSSDRHAGTQGRVGRGVPSGGQFTGVDRPESDIEL